MAGAKTMGLIFSNMHDEFFGDLTHHRTVGSVPFGGRYRLIDFTLSNMVNSGISDVGVVTKSNYQSLMDHIRGGRDWGLSRKIGGLTLLPPYSRAGASAGIYRGSIEALAGRMEYLRSIDADYVFMSDCDVISNLDVKEIVQTHIDCGADITVVYKEQKMQNGNRDAVTFTLAPNGKVKTVSINPDMGGTYNVYLNMIVVHKNLLIKLINDAYSLGKYSFSQHVLQEQAGHLKIYGYKALGYTARIADMTSYFAASMEMLDQKVMAELFPKSHPIYTKVRDEVPAKYGIKANVGNSLVADGCIIDGEVQNCIIFRGVKIGRGATVRNSIIMQGSIIGENASLNCVIADKNSVIRDGRVLSGYNTHPFYIQKGVVI